MKDLDFAMEENGTHIVSNFIAKSERAQNRDFDAHLFDIFQQ